MEMIKRGEANISVTPSLKRVGLGETLAALFMWREVRTGVGRDLPPFVDGR